MNKQIIIIGGIVTVALVAFGVYQMNSIVDNSAEQAETPRMNQERLEGRGPNGGQPPMEREQSEISLSDISVGQTVSVMGTTTNGTFVAESVMLMNQDFTGGRASGEGRQLPEDGSRPQFQGGPGGFPEGGMPPGDFGNRTIGEIASIDLETMTLTTVEGESLIVRLTSTTEYRSF